ncbi:MAG: NADH-quinone oxidoreductase subunit J [Phycisphaeraceae bacterium]|nr:MAG: NADH-quinone oxidoreductase subunit J [Phycisphaeraceae bacterium]
MTLVNLAIADLPINPLLLYIACALGAVGVIFAMPRRGNNPAIVGGLVAAVAAGLVVLGLTLGSGRGEPTPSVFFYIFALLALGGGLRMITHPKPVYAALYFILTIIASSGLYLLLSAEFMAFALVVIYAGAIIITYLFVIMLATQAPSADDVDALSVYDASAHEPIAASAAGFVLLALLTTMLFHGTPDLPTRPGIDSSDAILARLPGKVDDALTPILLANGLMNEDERIARMADTGEVMINSAKHTVLVTNAEVAGEAPTRETGRLVEVPAELWPSDLSGTNVEGLGLNLLGEHPMTIEIAGVVLLMAMLGATVLARKQVDLEEEAKARQARHLALDGAIAGPGGAN